MVFADLATGRATFLFTVLALATIFFVDLFTFFLFLTDRFFLYD